MPVIPLRKTKPGACCQLDHDADGNCPKHPFGVCANCSERKPGEKPLLWLAIEHLSSGGKNISGSYCSLRCLAEAVWAARQA